MRRRRVLVTGGAGFLGSHLCDRLIKDTSEPKSGKKKQNVLIVHNYYKVSGGEDTVVANEKKLLEENGHNVFLYTRSNTELDHMSNFAIARKTIFNFTTFREIGALIEEKSIDIIHVHNTLSIISPAVYYVARLKHVPIVQTVHNFRMICPNALLYRDGHICEECIQFGLRRAIKHTCYHNSLLQTIAIVLTIQIHRITKIYSKINYICLSEFNKNKLLLVRQIQSDRVFVKPNFTYNVSGMILSTPKNCNQFAYVGRLDKSKGIRILLEAWKEYEKKDNTMKLVICGTGPEEKWCVDFIDAFGLKCVEMKGFVDNLEVINTIANSKALVFPTQWYEGFPMIIVESFSVGTPVLASDIGNAGNLVVEGVTGYKFKHNSVEEIIMTLEKCCKEEFNKQDIFEYYKNHYDEKANYECLHNIYNNLIR